MKSITKNLLNYNRSVDIPLLIITIILLVVGIIMVYDATVVYSFTLFGGKYHFLILQAAWVIIGSFLMILVSGINYRVYPRYALHLLVLSIVLLILVIIPGIGIEIYGARRWLPFGFTTLQPSEIAKLSIIIYLASWWSADRRNRVELLKSTQNQLVKILMLIGLIIGLVLKEPNLSTALILCTIVLIMYFVAGAPWKYFILIMVILVCAAVGMVAVSPYRLQRIQTYLNSEEIDSQGHAYHINQIKIALGSGGLFGRGVGQSRQKYDYLPEVCSDSIFAIVGEEFGYLGSIMLIIALVALISRIFYLASQAADMLGVLMGAGIGGWFMVQTFVNLSAMVGLIPLTGIVLPFISCGGSAALISLIGIGIVLNISRSIQK